MKKTFLSLFLFATICNSVLAMQNYSNNAYWQRQQIIRNQEDQMWQQRQMHYEDINRREMERAEQMNRDMIQRERMRKQMMYDNFSY